MALHNSCQGSTKLISLLFEIRETRKYHKKLIPKSVTQKEVSVTKNMYQKVLLHEIPFQIPELKIISGETCRKGENLSKNIVSTKGLFIYYVITLGWGGTMYFSPTRRASLSLTA